LPKTKTNKIRKKGKKKEGKDSRIRNVEKRKENAEITEGRKRVKDRESRIKEE